MVAIPAVDESATIEAVVADVRKAIPQALIVVIDDGSVDGTAQLALAAGAEVLRLPFNVGVGGAMRTAFLYALQRDCDAVVQIDGDGQHDPSTAQALLDGLDHASVVVGSRFLVDPGYPVPRVRRWAMTIMASMVSRMTRTHLTDATSGFRAADRRAMTIFARHYPAEYLGDTIDSLVLAHRAGLTIREKPVTMRPRQGGSPSQGTFRSVLYLLRAMLALTMAVIRPAPEVSE